MLKNGIFNVIGVVATAAIGAAVGFVGGVLSTSKAMAYGSSLWTDIKDRVTFEKLDDEEETVSENEA